MLYDAVLLLLTHYIQYYAYQKTCAYLLLHQVSMITMYITILKFL